MVAVDIGTDDDDLQYGHCCVWSCLLFVVVDHAMVAAGHESWSWSLTVIVAACHGNCGIMVALVIFVVCHGCCLSWLLLVMVAAGSWLLLVIVAACHGSCGDMVAAGHGCCWQLLLWVMVAACHGCC